MTPLNGLPIGARKADPLIEDLTVVAQSVLNDAETVSLKPCPIIERQKHESPAFAGLSYESWRETRDSYPGNAINVRRFSRPIRKLQRAVALRARGVPLLSISDQARGPTLQGVSF